MWLWENISKLLKIFNRRPVTPSPYSPLTTLTVTSFLNIFSLGADIFATCWSVVGGVVVSLSLCSPSVGIFSSASQHSSSCQLTANMITSHNQWWLKSLVQSGSEIIEPKPMKSTFDRILGAKNSNHHEWVHIAWTAISVLTFSWHSVEDGKRCWLSLWKSVCQWLLIVKVVGGEDDKMNVPTAVDCVESWFWPE